jgi:D-alanyl-D-alanine dipeptidase
MDEPSGVEQRGPLRRLRPGSHPGGIWVQPVYRELGYGDALHDVWVLADLVPLLLAASLAVQREGHGLLLWDGWRSRELQRALYERYSADLAESTRLDGAELADVVARHVTDPDRATAPPAHLTGAAVDLTLCDPATGEPHAMGGEFDELSERSHPGYYDHRRGPEARLYAHLRAVLCAAMEDVGFVRFDTEWWHFERGTHLWAQRRGAAVLYEGTAGPAT